MMQVQTWQRSKRTSIFENKQSTDRVSALSAGRAIMVLLSMRCIVIAHLREIEITGGCLPFANFFFK
jgi:hypothetical protein